MSFFRKSIYSNLFEQKFSKPSNLISNDISFEIKFDGLENLNEETLLKSFYFFSLLFNRLPTFKNFKSKYHLGKTFYSFNLLLNLNSFSLFYFLSDFLETNLVESHKANFTSTFYLQLSLLKLSDLKIFSIVESNPHFFKWDKELKISFYLNNMSFTKSKLLNSYFWNMQTLKQKNYENFWVYYVV
jgi:hypothetical protein